MSYDPQHARFYGIIDTAYVKPDQWVEKCQALLDGGADIVQLRAKKESHDERIQLLENILPLFNNKLDRLVINDDLELVLKYPNLGLHIGPEDTSPLEARNRMGTDRLLGLSSHSLEQAENAISHRNILNYFCIGPVFATMTKPEYTPVGLNLLRTVSRLKTDLPLFSIGGITRDNLGEIKDAGAERVVVVSDVLCAQDTAAAVRDIRAAFAK